VVRTEPVRANVTSVACSSWALSRKWANVTASRAREIEMLTVEDIRDLQERLASAAWARRSQSPGVLTFVVFRREHLKVVMRCESNHRRPHFHLEYKREHAASYALDTFELLAGDVPRWCEREVIPWARERKDRLMKTWTDLCAGSPPQSLELEVEGD
jgi:hypothetical protein